MAEYPIPPWLGPQPQFGELYARGRAIGQAIENQRMQAQLQARALDQQAANAQLDAQVQSMRINAQMEMAQQEALQRQQAAAIEADYRQMSLAQARQKMMQDAEQNEQRMKLDLFKANTDWQQASQKFSAQQQMSNWITNRSKAVGLEQATKEGYMQFGHLLGGALPGGVFPNERQAPTITTINVPGRGPVDVVSGGQFIPKEQANIPPTMVAPNLVQVPKSGGGFEYRNVETQFKSKYDDKIEEMEGNLFIAKFLHNRKLKAETEDMQAKVDAQRALYDKMVKLRDEELRIHKALQPAMPGAPTNAPTATTNRNFNWTGSGLTPR